ncbi:MAG TPA: hypothetical protein PKA05_00385 [Roseiflexaceae bacterium]|nr:hypothetical protein [Roseiflexaceae bacterium]HMP38812.1 hypothetical protein [Roseiflexaceae bacterium]
MTVSKPKNATLIDILSDGYTTVNRRPWLVIIPLILNLYIAYGAQLSFAPLFERFGSFADRMQAAAPEAQQSDVSTAELLATLGRTDWRQGLAVLNFVPTLPVNQLVRDDVAVTEISAIPTLLLAFVLINLAALPTSAVFLSLVADSVRGMPVEALEWWRRAPQIGLAILAYIAIYAAVGLMLGLPFLFLTGLLMSFSPPIGALALTVILFAVFWIGIYIGFANEAIALHAHGPLQALRTSFNLVRRNFWATIGFLALAGFLIPSGSAIIWQAIAGSSVGMFGAVIGSAYIGSGLAVARMLFVHEYMRRAVSDAVPAQSMNTRL